MENFNDEKNEITEEMNELENKKNEKKIENRKRGVPLWTILCIIFVGLCMVIFFIFNKKENNRSLNNSYNNTVKGRVRRSERCYSR